MKASSKIFIYRNINKIYFNFFAVIFVVQIFFSLKVENVRVKLDIVPPLPTKYLINAISLGDNEFLFRILSARIQNSGDVFAGFLALKQYDYYKLYQWFLLLDELDSRSNIMPALASYYYAHTQNYPDTKYIVNYLETHASKDLDNKWWWLFQAIDIARVKLHDDDLALKLAYKMSENRSKTAPLWTRQMPAFLYEKKGNSCMAFKIIENIIKESEAGVMQISQKEMNFMKRFIRDKLSKLKQDAFDPSACRQSVLTK
jgi:hypothetical protein